MTDRRRLPDQNDRDRRRLTDQNDRDRRRLPDQNDRDRRLTDQNDRDRRLTDSRRHKHNKKKTLPDRKRVNQSRTRAVQYVTVRFISLCFVAFAVHTDLWFVSLPLVSIQYS